MDRWTKLVHFNPCPDDPFVPNSTPIYQTATFAQPSATAFGQYDYSRTDNPTRAVLEAQLAELEGCAHAFAFASGMAAICAVTRLLSCGDHLLAGDDLYGGTYRMLSRLVTRQGIRVSHVDTTDLNAVGRAITPQTRMLLVESPTNPLQRITDLRALGDLAHESGALVVVDNTLVSPWLQQPLSLGADLVVHSATKHLAGHSDLTAGVVAVRNSRLADELAFTRNAEGTALAPFDSWLLLRGLQTLPLRLERQQASAGKLAEFLARSGSIQRVYYPGLPDHPGHDLHASQARGPGSLISFETGDVEISRRIVESTRLFTVSVSFGALHSLISLPCRMSHASIPDSERSLPPDLVRLSVGIEDPIDLAEDLDAAIRSARAGAGSKHASPARPSWKDRGIAEPARAIADSTYIAGTRGHDVG